MAAPRPAEKKRCANKTSRSNQHSWRSGHCGFWIWRKSEEVLHTVQEAPVQPLCQSFYVDVSCSVTQTGRNTNNAGVGFWFCLSGRCMNWHTIQPVLPTLEFKVRVWRHPNCAADKISKAAIQNWQPRKPFPHDALCVQGDSRLPPPSVKIGGWAFKWCQRYMYKLQDQCCGRTSKISIPTVRLPLNRSTCLNQSIPKSSKPWMACSEKSYTNGPARTSPTMRFTVMTVAHWRQSAFNFKAPCKGPFLIICV